MSRQLGLARRLDLSPDGWLLLTTCGIRSFAFGFLSVILGLYLAELGLGPATIGTLFTAALAGGAVMTVTLTSIADRLSRRLVLMATAALMGLGGVVFAITDNALLLTLAALVGTISPSGKDVGTFLSVEQAILPQTTSDRSRTGLFAYYNLVGSLASAFGALVAGVPDLVGLAPLQGYRLLVLAYAAIGLLLIVLFSRLSQAAEAEPSPREISQLQQHDGRTATQRPNGAWARFGIHRSQRIVVQLAALFALDSFAGGFIVQGLVAYWFNQRYGVEAAGLGALFFGTNLLAAVSFLAAAPLARRIGLLNTMVFTHLPSNVMLLLVPIMPGVELATGMLLARHLLSQLDVPTRQSYTMAIVAREERSAVAGLTSVARNAAAALAPALAGASLAPSLLTLGVPFLVAGTLKIIYDLSMLARFRHVRPAEETGSG